jgi:NAD(P)H-hydrate epimerase
MKVVTVEQMQALERECGVPIPQLMENAGLAVAQEAWLLLGDVQDRRIVVLAGPGNNGGDGLVAARHLHDWGAKVSVYLLRSRGEDDPNFRHLTERQVAIASAENDPDFKTLTRLLADAELVIDALLGTGRARAVEGTLAEVLKRLAEARDGEPLMLSPERLAFGESLSKYEREERLTQSFPKSPQLLAVDLPTGLDADTGAVDPLCVAADLTVPLGHGKVGLHTSPGAEYAGRVSLADIGIPKDLSVSLPYELMEASSLRSLLPKRPANSNKGTFGKALVAAGSVNYVGAAALACTSAGRVGAGLVTLACPQTVYPILAGKLTESTFLPLPDVEGQLSAESVAPVVQTLELGYNALVVGCGLGQSAYVRAFVHSLLPLLTQQLLRGIIIDADGLNSLADYEWWGRTNVPVVLTPHPGEMARLTGLSVAEIQADRLRVALRFAAQWGVVVLLKGAHTVVVSPDGRGRISPFANPALATAGTGDVLAGAIGGLIAQGLSTFDAASAAVYLHAEAGERLRREIGDSGMLAGDLLPMLPLVMRDLST